MEQWAEIRRMHLVEGLSIRGIARRTGRDRKTIRKAIRSPSLRAIAERRGIQARPLNASRSRGCCAMSRGSRHAASAS